MNRHGPHRPGATIRNQKHDAYEDRLLLFPGPPTAAAEEVPLLQHGKDHNYLDDLTNRTILQKVAHKCYLPMNTLLLEQIKAHKGKFRVSFSMSGLAIEQFRIYAPEVLDSFRALAKTAASSSSAKPTRTRSPR